MNEHLHPIFQQALAPFAPPEQQEANERLRDKINEEYACGFDSFDDEGDDE